MTNSEQREAARQFANTWKNGGDEIVGVRIIQCNDLRKRLKLELSAELLLRGKLFFCLSK